MEPRRHVLGPVTVSRIGFGAMQLPGPGVFGPPRDRTAAIAVLRRAVELGVDHIDTAQYYGPGVANDLIRTALHAGRARHRISDRIALPVSVMQRAPVLPVFLDLFRRWIVVVFHVGGHLLRENRATTAPNWVLARPSRKVRARSPHRPLAASGPRGSV